MHRLDEHLPNHSSQHHDPARIALKVLKGTLPQQRVRRGREDLRQEHRAPATLFSVAAFSQVHLRADCLPQEHLAWAAQTQDSPERPQQVLGAGMVRWGNLVWDAVFDVLVLNG